VIDVFWIVESEIASFLEVNNKFCEVECGELEFETDFQNVNDWTMNYVCFWCRVCVLV
jgi:hypothetical protein